MRPPKEIRNLRVCAIKGDRTPDQITGTNNVNVVDQIDGKGGGDTLTGNRGWNGLIGGKGEDTIEGGSGTDIVFAIDAVKQTTTGENAQVTLEGNPEIDTVSCGAGNDTVYVDGNVDIVDGEVATGDPTSTCEQVNLEEPDIPVAHWFRRLVGKK